MCAPPVSQTRPRAGVWMPALETVAALSVRARVPRLLRRRGTMISTTAEEANAAHARRHKWVRARDGEGVALAALAAVVAVVAVVAVY